MKQPTELHVPPIDREALASIVKKAGLSDAAAHDLTARFMEIGEHFRRVVLRVPSTMRLGPSNLPARRREKLLHRAVIAPADALLHSLEAKGLLEAWPDTIGSELAAPEMAELRRLLHKLRTYANDLSECVADRSADGSTLNAELSYDLVSQLADACDAVGISVTRGYVGGHGNTSLAADAIMVACRAITGGTFPIDDELRQYIKLKQAK